MLIKAFAFCEKPLATFPEVLKPTRLIVTDSHIYIAEAYKVHIYSVQDFKHQKSFGKKGEGPKEFNTSFGGIRLEYFNEKLYIGSFRKELTYNKNGDFLNEKKWSRIIRNLKPINGGYFSYHFHFEFKKNRMTYQIAILDKDLNEKKILHKEINTTKVDTSRPVPALKGNVFATLDNNYIILHDARKDFSIKLFSHQGELIKDLNIEYPKLRIEKTYKNSYRKQYLKPDRSTQFSAMMSQVRQKRKIVFPEYFPPFRNVASDNKKIYVFRDIPEFEKYEVWVLSYKGEVLDKHKMIKQKLYSIHNGTFYFLQESEETEEWELFSNVLFNQKSTHEMEKTVR